MTKKLTVGSESYDYSVTGDINYGEANTNWSEAITDSVAEFFGPGDIKTAQQAITEGTTADVPGLSFDTSFVQRIEITGIITRNFNVAATKVDSFKIEGSYNGIEFNITAEYIGDDVETTLFMVAGQVRYTAAIVADTSEMTIKFQAKTIIDKEAV